MTNSNSSDVTESKAISTRATGEAGTDERRSAEERGQRADGDSTYRVHGDESVTEAVVRAVSSETQTEPLRLQPLHSVIDTDALNELLTPPNGGVRQTDGSVAFDYSGRQVRVRADGRIRISPLS